MITSLQYNFWKRLIILMVVLLVTAWPGHPSGVTAAPLLQGQDLAVIAEPASNAVLRETVQIVGSADYPSFQFYIIEFSPEPVSGNQWQIIGQIHEQPVINGVLETWDTTQVPDGSYTLRLRVVRLDGNYSEAFAQQIVVANAQPEPTATDTPTPEGTVPAAAPSAPTVTPTALPPTPTIVIEQPIVDTPTPRAVPTISPLADPEEDDSFIPTVSGFSIIPLRDACFYGGGIMVSIFLFFGFLSALRGFVQSMINRRRGL